ncbi:MAG TPA: cell division protein ZipA C-terminal FtsZ-binding domain-containing protein [Steroidobacter sp.]|uniref:cell division protein ZipA C-terminal FtsZ-binding domain-containing protein n=1 Tax=Steroidobacter sp. TaxID=1978227 RepID=UPI002ED8721A
MSELRWILIGFGIVLLAGIYLWGRRGGAAVAEDVALRGGRPEPAMQPHGFADAPSPSYEDEPYEEDQQPAAVAPRQLDRADDYEVTAARQVSPRSEARLARGEAPRPAFKEIVPAASTSGEPARPLPDFRRGRVEPTIGADVVTEELRVQPAAGETATAVITPAPTLSSSETPPPRRSNARKILSLRLSLAPQRVEGAKLQEVLQEELLTHGKYEIFHRLHSDGQSVFSVASMVEPGSFDLEKMGETLYPGVTLFAQLPGPVPGMHALNELVACARRLHQSLGGVLQDDRGVPLTVHRIERMRQEVRDFERPPGARGHQE